MFINRCVLPWNKGKSTSAVPAYIFLGGFRFSSSAKRLNRGRHPDRFTTVVAVDRPNLEADIDL